MQKHVGLIKTKFPSIWTRHSHRRDGPKNTISEVMLVKHCAFYLCWWPFHTKLCFPAIHVYRQCVTAWQSCMRASVRGGLPNVASTWMPPLCKCKDGRRSTSPCFALHMEQKVADQKITSHCTFPCNGRNTTSPWIVIPASASTNFSRHPRPASTNSQSCLCRSCQRWPNERSITHQCTS